jgi:Tol biopolymer transport system component
MKHLFILLAIAASAHGALLRSSDLYKLRSVGDVAISPDAKHVAYVVERNESEGRPKGQLSIMDLETNKTVALGDRSGSPLWSPDGAWLAFSERQGEKSGLMIVRADGSGARLLAETSGTNAPVPEQGKSVAWSPDGKTIAFVSATPGPETSEANGDPVVIRRYLYKPDLVAGDTRVNDNKRLHIFLCDVASGHVKQLTNGAHNEHSIDFAPDGSEIVFASNREENEDQFFNYDLFAVKVADVAIRRITSTESAEYAPQFSPDGKQVLFLEGHFRCPVPSSQFPVPSSQFPVPNSQCPVPSARGPTGHRAPATGHWSDKLTRCESSDRSLTA